ncbi:MAG TPA: phosphate ABC transporter permease subunit PstC, partial [Epsilonproteobacteria bacterium]|nr:phosphate ABC transporter permease subunit PstC [Campylobacterota bacterium]
MGGKLFRTFSFFSAMLSFFLLVGIFAILFTYAQDALHEFGFDFLWTEQWEPGEDDEGGIFGGYIPILGTLLSTIIAMVIAIPLAMGIAIFLTEIASVNVAKP